MNKLARTTDPQGRGGSGSTGNSGQDDAWSRLAEIREVDVGPNAEIAVRFVLIGLASGALTYATGSWAFVAWAVLTISFMIIYRWRLSRAGPETAERDYPRIILLNAVNTMVFAAMPVYLWITSDVFTLKAIAICGIICHTMYNLVAHRYWNVVAFWEVGTVLLSISVIAIYEIIQAPTDTARLLIAVGCIAFSGYAVVAQTYRIRDRRALHRSRSAELDAQKMSAMAKVTGGIAHDFNNLLTAIQGNIELAELTHDPKERRSYLQQARASTERGGALVAQMMAYVGKSQLYVTDLELREFLPDIRRKLALLMVSGLRVDVEPLKTSLVTRTDRALLETALINLALNAKQALSGQSGAISLRASPAPPDRLDGTGLDPSQSYVLFEMRDTGPGVAEPMLPLLTEPFYTTKPAGEGSGMGLSMVKGFVEQQGGSMTLRNHPEGGLEVSLFLPAGTPA